MLLRHTLRFTNGMYKGTEYNNYYDCTVYRPSPTIIYIVIVIVFGNSSDKFDSSHCWIKVKVTLGLQSFYLYATI